MIARCGPYSLSIFAPRSSGRRRSLSSVAGSWVRTLLKRGSILTPNSGIIDAPRAAHQAGRARSGLLMDIVLTGIKPTGTLHVGNYVGAIKPAIAASATPGVESYFFLADYHAIGGDADLVAQA